MLKMPYRGVGRCRADAGLDKTAILALLCPEDGRSGNFWRGAPFTAARRLSRHEPTQLVVS
jgi:hypothetical protein